MKILLLELNSKSGINIFNRILFDYLSGKDLEVKIFTLPLMYEPILDFIKFRENLTKFIKKKIDYENYDIIHTSSILGNFLDAHLVTFHLLNIDANYLKFASFFQRFYWTFWIRQQEKKSLKKAKAVTAVSKYTAIKVKEAYGILPEVIYNGIDLNLFKPLNLPKGVLLKKFNLPFDYLDKKIILFAGNATRRKGFDILKALMRQLDESYICLTCGLRISGSQNKIISLHNVPYETMPFLYNLCDVYFHPARLEGFGLTVVEAMACEKPVVCSNVSCLPELVVERKGGLLCNLSVQEFKKSIEFLMDNQLLRREMGEFNRKRCSETFDCKIMGDSYLNLYKNILGQ